MSGPSGAMEWDEPTFRAALKQAQAEGTIDAPDLSLSAERLQQLIQAAPEDPQWPGRRALSADFNGATFLGDVDFSEVTFTLAAFGRATFSGTATFSEAIFNDDADFTKATFSSRADFTQATFSSRAAFYSATFRGPAALRGADFRGYAAFIDATFHDDADFADANFRAAIAFAWARFVAISFFGASFAEARRFGPVLGERLVLDGTVFEPSVKIEVSALMLSCDRAIFSGGVDMRVRWAAVSLEDSDFAEPSLLTDLTPNYGHHFTQRFLGWERPVGDGRWVSLQKPPEDFTPRVRSLRGAKVARLTLSGVNMTTCRFAGVHDLDELRLERVYFAQPPAGWRRARRWAFVRWTRRQTVVEEHHWRHHHGHGRGWVQTYEDDLLEPEQIAAIYRALRKGREDNKDEPGAGDFYYGEMEMRRHAKGSGAGRGEIARTSPRAERFLLTLYWLVSGYGLRASRALAALVLAVALFTAGFHLYGFRDRVRPYATRTELQPAPAMPFPPSPGDVVDAWGSFDAWTYSAGTATAVIGAPESQLTRAGQGMRIPLRVLGPLLLGLALLAIRGRVKR
jgi:uncharacterized protein YjbI with pentapeptide repeats